MPSDRFGEVWKAAPENGEWVLGFHLVDLVRGVERIIMVEPIDEELLEAIDRLPHFVVLTPGEFLGDATALADVASRLQGSVFVLVEQPSIGVRVLRSGEALNG